MLPGEINTLPQVPPTTRVVTSNPQGQSPVATRQHPELLLLQTKRSSRIVRLPLTGLPGFVETQGRGNRKEVPVSRKSIVVKFTYTRTPEWWWSLLGAFLRPLLNHSPLCPRPRHDTRHGESYGVMLNFLIWVQPHWTPGLLKVFRESPSPPTKLTKPSYPDRNPSKTGNGQTKVKD